MSNRTIEISDSLYEYMLSASLRESKLQRQLRAETSELTHASMQISPEQGQFMGLLVELLGVQKALEVGTFTGYSALAVALSLPPDGKLVACDVSEEWTSIARRYWREAGVAERIDLRLGPAVGTLDDLIDSGQEGSFDFAFIDADKSNYDRYYERCLRLVRVGGLIAVDNVLWHGKTADPEVQDADTLAIRALNLKIQSDDRVSSTLVPIGDGLYLARKR